MKKPPSTQPWERKKRQWFRVLFNLRCSVIPAITPRIALCTGFGLLISVLHWLNFNVSIPILSSVVPSIVLGLLLVFRTNTAYERFWEGRKQWGTLVNTVRNLARTMWVSIATPEPEDRRHKVAALRLLVAFAVATKLHLRSEKVNSEIAALMPPRRYELLQDLNNPPLDVALWIGDYLQQQYERQRVNAYQLTAMFKLLDIMVDVLGACERILKTPLPLAYSIHIKQLLLIYCLTLPFQVVAELGWWTGLIVGVVSFSVFGIEEIGIEIENPFGHDPNDLPLDDICRTMQINVEDLIAVADKNDGIVRRDEVAR